MYDELISVIVPIYNVETYLSRCVDSIIRQTYSDLDIILVNDGSEDQSGLLCERYAMTDSRIRVIHKKNGGLSDARNAGLSVALGKYVTFIDSDDFVADDFVEYLYKLTKENDAQISVCDYLRFTQEIQYKQEKESLRKYTKDEALNALLYQRSMTSSACGKLYDIRLYQDVRFPVGKLHEDVAVMYRLFYNSDVIVRGGCKKYFYYQREDSIVHRQYNSRRMDYLEFTEKCILFMQENCPYLIKAAVSRHFSACFELLTCIPLEDKAYQNDYKKIVQEIKKSRKCVLLDTNSRKKNRIAALMSFVSVRLVRNLCVLLK